MLFFIGGIKSTLSVTTIASHCIALQLWCNVKIAYKISRCETDDITNRERTKKPGNILFHTAEGERDSVGEWMMEIDSGRLAWTCTFTIEPNCITEQTTVQLHVTHELYSYHTHKKISFPVHLEQCVPKLYWLIRYAEWGIRIRATAETKICATNSTFCSLVDDQLSKIW